MRRRAAFLAFGLGALGLAALGGCASDGGGAPDGAAPTAAAGDAAGTVEVGAGAAVDGTAGASGLVLPTPQPGAPASPEAGRRAVDPEDIRDIYLAFDGQPGSVVSVIFAIDSDANGNPADQPALRLSPENGACNPQELAGYAFPAGSTRVFGLEQAQRGVTPADLPRFLAATVTEAMLRDGLAPAREDTLPQNVCTRKLWEVLVANQRARAQAAGQL